MASIKCGDHRHSSVAEVRACQMGSGASSVAVAERPWYPEAAAEQARGERIARDRANAQRRSSSARSGWTPRTVKTATEKAQNWCRSLADLKEIPGHFQWRVDELVARLNTASAREVSQMIDALKILPNKAPEDRAGAAPADLPEVPAGRYALRTDGVVKFYRVDRPTEGRWAGKVFLSVQASDETHPVRNFSSKREILERIAEDTNAAQALYGQELGRCYRCGRTLTDELSRSLGIGPDCRSK